MRKGTKRYELNDNVTLENLLNNNFKEGGFMKEIPSPKYYYYKRLIDDIELYIEVNINGNEITNFDDINNILVIDDSFCQPYYPFYEGKKEFDFLNKVIKKYNEAMDELVEKGILKEKILKEDNNKKLIKKV